LKYLSSVYLFVQNDSIREGELHDIRKNFISNKALLDAAYRTGLCGYIQSIPFSLKSWKLTGYGLPTTPRPEKTEQIVDEISSAHDGSHDDTLAKENLKRRRRVESAEERGQAHWLADKVVSFAV